MGSYDRLHEFIAEKMRMSHIYQPVMLRVLLENGGRASKTASRSPALRAPMASAMRRAAS